MKEYNTDTSETYEDLVGYVAEENLPKDLSTLLGQEKEYAPQVKPKTRDPVFPEDWQNLYVNFRTEQDYIEFMNLLSEKPVPKLKKFVFEEKKTNPLMSLLQK